jgi:hypothetical protein
MHQICERMVQIMSKLKSNKRKYFRIKGWSEDIIAKSQAEAMMLYILNYIGILKDIRWGKNFDFRVNGSRLFKSDILIESCINNVKVGVILEFHGCLENDETDEFVKSRKFSKIKDYKFDNYQYYYIDNLLDLYNIFIKTDNKMSVTPERITFKNNKSFLTTVDLPILSSKILDWVGFIELLNESSKMVEPFYFKTKWSEQMIKTLLEYVRRKNLSAKEIKNKLKRLFSSVTEFEIEEKLVELEWRQSRERFLNLQREEENYKQCHN